MWLSGGVGYSQFTIIINVSYLILKTFIFLTNIVNQVN